MGTTDGREGKAVDFLEVLDEILELLRTRGRITYRALSLHFTLDEETLEALKDEVLFTYPVVDEDGLGLAWTGEPSTSFSNVYPIYK